jgi:4-amino-4-deoxy-L-arabinose transferase-like glycosyltransferase
MWNVNLASTTDCKNAVVNRLNSTSDSLHWTVFAGLLSLAVVLRLALFQGYSGSDPRAYFRLADDLARGIVHVPQYEGPPVFPLRIGVYAPTAAFIMLFGVSEVTLVAYPFLMNVAGCLLVYALARKLETPLAGLFALAALAILPIDISMASMHWPDGIAACWANLGVAFTLLALSKRTLRQVAALAAAGGICFGISWLCKETVVYLVPFVVILLLLLQRTTVPSVRAVTAIAVATAVAGILAGESVFYATTTGDPLFRYNATEQNYEHAAVLFFNSSLPDSSWRAGRDLSALARRLMFTGPRDILFVRTMNFLPALALMIAALALVFRRHVGTLASVWLVSLLLTFNFMTSSFKTYTPLSLLIDRYLYPVIVPSLILFGGVLAALMTSRSDARTRAIHRACASVVMLAFCAASAIGVFVNARQKYAEEERQAVAHLRANDVVYSDLSSVADLVFFRTGTLLNSNATTIPWEGVDLRSGPPGSYVFVNRDRIEYLEESYHYRPPPLVEKPPATWKSVSTYGNAELYRVMK